MKKKKVYGATVEVIPTVFWREKANDYMLCRNHNIQDGLEATQA